MLGKGSAFVDRTIYDKKGKWKSPNSDHEETIFYYISKPLSMVATYDNGMEELKPTMEITIFGEHAFCNRDKIKLETGAIMFVDTTTIVYVEHNQLVKDLLKPRVDHIIVTLE